MEVEIPRYLDEEQKLFKTFRVKSLEEIPISNGAYVLDLDGVLCFRGERNNLMSNGKRLASLLNLTREANRVCVSTARFDLVSNNSLVRKFNNFIEKKQNDSKSGVCFWPWLSGNSQLFLRNLFNNQNPECEIVVCSGFGKIVDGGDTLGFINKSLKDGLDVAMVGSGYFDKRVAKRAIEINPENSERLSFFALGNGLI